MFIGADSSSRFTILIVVDKDVFITEEIRKAYEIATKIRKSTNTESFIIDYDFEFLHDPTDEKSIYNRGFFLKYYEKD